MKYITVRQLKKILDTYDDTAPVSIDVTGIMGRSEATWARCGHVLTEPHSPESCVLEALEIVLE